MWTCARESRQPSTMLAWFNASLKTASPSPARAVMRLKFARKPEPKTRAASFRLKAASARASSSWAAMWPEMSGEAAPLAPAVLAASTDASMMAEKLASPR